MPQLEKSKRIMVSCFLEITWKLEKETTKFVNHSGNHDVFEN